MKEDQISLEKKNGTPFSIVFYVKEFLNNRMYNKAINIIVKNFNSQKHTKERSAKMSSRQLFLFIFYVEENSNGSPKICSVLNQSSSTNFGGQLSFF